MFSTIRIRLAGLLLLFRIPSGGSAQVAADTFDAEIDYYRQLDTTQQLPEHPILFIGSSSVKNWYAFDSVFSGYVVLNRGFGGSQLTDIIHYAPDVILKYDPKQIVIYAGENDFAKSDSVSASTVFSRFKELYDTIRRTYPDIPVLCMSVKPSPAKRHMMRKIETYNQLLRDFTNTESNLTFVDVYAAMLRGDGKPDRELFLSDMTHMNEKGYEAWNELLLPLLLH